ncbi:MAG: hypothetical protein RLY88_973 [Actinomycetota bacterium]|jgi:O-antigen ligase
MNALTRPIRVVFNTREKGYRTKTAIASVGLFTLLAGDAVRYSVGWWGWAIVLAAVLTGVITLLIKNRSTAIFNEIPLPLYLLLAWMALSTIWSAYPGFSALATLAQLLTTLVAIFLAALFSWRHLLRIFANVIRFTLISSLLFEFIAAAIVHGPIAPIFKNYEGDVPPAPAFYWTQGHLFDGNRIQGIVGNSNLLAYVAMLGVVIFFVEYLIVGTSRWLSAASLVLSVGAIWLAKSAGVGFAMAAIAISAIVSFAAEGKDRATRHKYYRIAWASAGTVAVIVLFYRAQVFELIGKSPDMTGRSGIWKIVLHLIEQKPWLGWGWISYWVPGVKPYDGLVVINNVPYFQAHNAYLDVWLQLGIIGLLIFAALLVVSFVKIWRLAVRHTSALYLWPIFILIGLLVWSLTESRMLIESGWLILTLLAVKVNEPSENLEALGRSPKRAKLLNFDWMRISQK